MERRQVPFSVVNLDFEGRTIEGYAAVFGNVDLVNDVIVPGAFAKTIGERGRKVQFLWQHNPAEPLGKVLALREDEKGLFIKAGVSDTARGRDVLALLKDGAIDGLSIGFDPIENAVEYQKLDGRIIRKLREVKLWEFSLVTFPANEEAQVTALKAATIFQDLPLAPRERPWDGAAAEGRVRNWAGGPDKENMDWAKYRRAFLWYDSGDTENLRAYKLGYADIIGGALTAVPRGIFACAVVLSGGRGGVDIPAGDQQACKGHLTRYYKKMELEAPWEKGLDISFELAQAEPTEAKPYPNEHACRLRDPGAFQDGSFRRMERRSDGKPYGVVMGRLKGETTMTEQSYRYGIEDWTPAEARTHCADHDGKFEAAVPKKDEGEPMETKVGRVLSKTNEDRLRRALAEITDVIASLGEEQKQDPTQQTGIKPETKAEPEAIQAEPLTDELLKAQIDQALLEIKALEVKSA